MTAISHRKKIDTRVQRDISRRDAQVLHDKEFAADEGCRVLRKNALPVFASGAFGRHARLLVGRGGVADAALFRRLSIDI